MTEILTDEEIEKVQDKHETRFTCIDGSTVFCIREVDETNYAREIEQLVLGKLSKERK